MRVALNTLGDDTEAVVLHRRTAANTTKQTLLDTLLELDNSDTGRRRGDLNGDLADGEPGDEDADSHEEEEPELLVGDDTGAAGVELVRLHVIAVAENREEPSYGAISICRKADERVRTEDNAEPANKAMVTLKDAEADMSS